MAKKEKVTQDTQEDSVEDETLQDRNYRRRNKPRSLLGAVIIIFVGIIFLLNNLEILPRVAWRQLWRLWPVLLILFGIEMIFGRSRWAQIIIGILVILFLFGFIWYFLAMQGIVAPIYFPYLHKLGPPR